MLTHPCDSTYDEYNSELQSGHLSWTPVHESDMFWKENATKLNDGNHQQLKYVSRVSSPPTSYKPPQCRVLVELLKNSQDPLVLAVASHDIGQYVKHYPRGKKYTPFP